MKTSGMDIRNHKKRGVWAELRFMTKATELGFQLAEPRGDTAPYDVVLDLGGRFIRVQVKSTFCQASNTKPGTFIASLRHVSGPGSRYQQSDFDYLALYCIPRDIWYIIPSVVAVSRTDIRVCPGDEQNQWEPYREAWHLLLDRAPAPLLKRGQIDLYGIIEDYVPPQTKKVEAPRWLFLHEPKQRVPHLCVLCKGGRRHCQSNFQRAEKTLPSQRQRNNSVIPTKAKRTGGTLCSTRSPGDQRATNPMILGRARLQSCHCDPHEARALAPEGPATRPRSQALQKSNRSGRHAPGAGWVLLDRMDAPSWGNPAPERELGRATLQSKMNAIARDSPSDTRQRFRSPEVRDLHPRRWILKAGGSPAGL